MRRPRPTAALAALLVVAAGWAPGSAAAAVSLPFARIVGAGSNENAGGSVAVAGDVNGDGHADVVVGASRAQTGPERRDGAAYVVFGPIRPREQIDLASLGARGFTMVGPRAGDNPYNGSLTGVSVAGAGDVNGDGLADVVVGAPAAGAGDETVLNATGRAYVVFGTRRPRDVQLATLGDAGITLTGPTLLFPDTFGSTVAAAGDLDGDGLDDVAIDAPGNGGFEDDHTAGHVYVVYGRRTPGTLATGSFGRDGFKTVRLGVTDGNAIASAGDWNRDGRADLAISSASADRFRGAVRLIYGRRYRGELDVDHLGRNGLTVRGGPGAPYYRFMDAALAGGADVTGDGRADLVLGRPNDGPGRAWLIAGTRSRSAIELLAKPSTRAWEVARSPDGSRWGMSSVALGRIDGDRRADIVLLAKGTPFVVYGKRGPRTAQLGDLKPGRGFELDASEEPETYGTPGLRGFSTVAAGDVTGDGRAEILAGAGSSTTSHLGRERPGSVYVFFAR